MSGQQKHGKRSQRNDPTVSTASALPLVESDALVEAGVLGLLDETMLSSFGLEAFVPDSLAKWRPLVVDGLRFFLQHLPVERVREIATVQWQLPQMASAAQRLVTLLAYCPTLHKLGQVLARHMQLPTDLRKQLQQLESMPALLPLEQIVASIQTELSGLAKEGASLAELAALQLGTQALAEGSVAIVLPFSYPTATGKAHGVFKILKPQIEEKLRCELLILVELGTYLEQRSRALGLPSIDYHDTLETVRRLMIKEIQLTLEQHNLRAAAEFYADEPRILIPRLLPWCTARMTAMERVFGQKATDLALSPEQRRTLAETMMATLLAQPFWSSADQTVVHADLHAGNLLLTEDGRLAVLDWSLIACLGKTEREALVAIVLAGMTLDARRMRVALASLGTLNADDPLLYESAERALNLIVREGHLPGFNWLIALLDDVALHAMASVWEDFILLRKTCLSLSGVIHDIDANVTPDAQIIALAMRRLLAELPVRTLAHPARSDFATHISNAELLKVCCSPWLVTTRYYLRWWGISA